MTIGALIRREWDRLIGACARLDRQVVFVLLAAAVAMILQNNFGSRRFFRTELAAAFPEHLHGILQWAWWFVFQGIVGFVLPAAALLFIFRRRRAEIGLGLGDWKLALLATALYVPLVIVGTWILSNRPDFQASYPHFHGAARDWGTFAAYEFLFLFYWVGWEYLWRGFVLFGTVHVFGLYAIFVQAVPFTILHLDKPLPETVLSLVGGLALGALVWRCRAFWIAVPIHFIQMLVLDFWCTMRVRTGAQGIGLDALMRLFGT